MLPKKMSVLPSFLQIGDGGLIPNPSFAAEIVRQLTQSAVSRLRNLG